MSKIKIEKAYAKRRVTSFGGIREGISKNGDSASDIRNFQICSDGSLEKRNGWTLWRHFNTPLRGFWEGTIENEHFMFAVAGNTVYRVYEEQSVVQIGTLSSTSGNVLFQRYRDRLYLMDGTAIRVFTPGSQAFVAARGYVPLYGYNWHPTQLGDINEPVNLLNQSLRVHYLNTTGVKTFSLPFFAASLDSVRVNNRKITAYSFAAGSDTFTLSSASAGDVVEIAMTISGSNSLQQQLHGVTNGCLQLDGIRERLFLYGAPQGYRIFASSEVSDIMLTYCSIFYSDCDPLYFKQTQMLLIGDADHPVTAITSNFDRLLAFTTTGTYSISTSDDKTYSYPVLSDLGCGTRGAAVQIGNDSIVINDRGICRLHATSSDPDNLSIHNLSEKLGSSWRKKLSENILLFWHSAKQELWVRDADESFDGIVWIWNAALDEWYCFDNIPALFFALYNGKILFGTQKDLCFFEEGIYTDNGVKFNAYYQSNYMSLDTPHAVKRSLRTAISATNGAQLLLTLDTENASHVFAFEGKNRSAPEFFDVRLAPGRFRFLCYRITCIGENASKIHEANFFTTL